MSEAQNTTALAVTCELTHLHQSTCNRDCPNSKILTQLPSTHEENATAIAVTCEHNHLHQHTYNSDFVEELAQTCGLTHLFPRDHSFCETCQDFS